MHTHALIRPAWTPATIALMVIGFMVFWPLGLAMLAYIIWGDRLDGFKRDVNSKTDGFFASCRGRHRGHRGRDDTLTKRSRSSDKRRRCVAP